MAYCIVTFYPGGTKAQYNAEIAVVHPRGGASSYIMRQDHRLVVGQWLPYTIPRNHRKSF